jgi:hypothetical protein
MQYARFPRNALILFLLAGLGRFGYASDLYGYWLFNESGGTTAADSSGNGLTGTLSPTGAIFDPGAGPDGGGAINLSQANDGYVNMGNPASLAFGGSGGAVVSWTVQAWINTTQRSTDSSIIAGEQVGAVNEGYGLGFGNMDGAFGCTDSSYDGKAAGYTTDGGGGCFGTEFQDGTKSKRRFWIQTIRTVTWTDHQRPSRRRSPSPHLASAYCAPRGVAL